MMNLKKYLTPQEAADLVTGNTHSWRDITDQILIENGYPEDGYFPREVLCEFDLSPELQQLVAIYDKAKEISTAIAEGIDISYQHGKGLNQVTSLLVIALLPPPGPDGSINPYQCKVTIESLVDWFCEQGLPEMAEKLDPNFKTEQVNEYEGFSFLQFANRAQQDIYVDKIIKPDLKGIDKHLNTEAEKMGWHYDHHGEIKDGLSKKSKKLLRRVIKPNNEGEHAYLELANKGFTALYVEKRFGDDPDSVKTNNWLNTKATEMGILLSGDMQEFISGKVLMPDEELKKLRFTKKSVGKIVDSPIQNKAPINQ